MTLWWVLFAAVEVGLLLLLITQKRILARLGQLTRDVTAIAAASDFSRRVDVTGKDELGRLEGAVNGMLDELQRTREAELRNERLYRTITDHLPIGIGYRDSDLNLVAANPRMMQWFPDVTDNTAILHSYSLRLRAKDRAEEPHPCWLALQDGQVHEERIAIPVRGESRIFDITVCPIVDETQQCANVIELMMDVTERERLAQKMKRLERLESVGTLAAGVAHEINTPLNVIELNAGALEMRLDDEAEVTPETIRKHLGAITNQIGRISEIIKHMRALARQDESHTVMPVQVNEIIEEALKMIAAQVADHGIRLETDLAENLPEVLANAIQLEQVVLNLVVNAMHALDGSTAPVKTIHIRTKRAGGRVGIIVRDNGPGLGRDTERIFDPFYTTKDCDRGTGLGLSLVHAFVSAWGGEIGAANHAGGGAVFHVTFPIPKTSESPAAKE